jgi:hypothetical protein
MEDILSCPKCNQILDLDLNYVGGVYYCPDGCLKINYSKSGNDMIWHNINYKFGEKLNVDVGPFVRFAYPTLNIYLSHWSISGTVYRAVLKHAGEYSEDVDLSGVNNIDELIKFLTDFINLLIFQ